MYEENFEEAVEFIGTKDPRYQREAYLFVREALDHTQKAMGEERQGRIRHVTGQELLKGIKDHALAQFGPMAMMVLEEWGIHTCQDFGEIVFNMVENGGPPALTVDDLLDVPGLATRLRAHADPVSAFLWGRFSEAGRQAPHHPSTKGTDAVLVKELNEIIHGPSVYEASRFAGVDLSEQTRLLLAHEPREGQTARLNRFLLQDAYPTQIAKSGGLLAKTDRDSRADFSDGYDFFEAFRRPFLPSGKTYPRDVTPAPSSSN
jgi:uncharacterized repeat protein (TIGR04138 family)